MYNKILAKAQRELVTKYNASINILNIG
ncbi:hypothetical protein ACQ9ZF_12000 (plasmid) [Cetobacterium somerae]